MIEKMRAYIETAKTNPDTTDEELLRMAEEYAAMETDAEAVKTTKVNRSFSRICFINYDFFTLGTIIPEYLRYLSREVQALDVVFA